MSSLLNKDPSMMNKWELERLEQELNRTSKSTSESTRRGPGHYCDCGCGEWVSDEEEIDGDEGSYDELENDMDKDFDDLMAKAEQQLRKVAPKAQPIKEWPYSMPRKSPGDVDEFEEAVRRSENNFPVRETYERTSPGKLVRRDDHYELQELSGDKDDTRGFMKEENRVESTFRSRRPRGLGFRSKPMF